MTAPRRLQLRRGNTAAISAYVGAAGELVVNTTTNTLYLHDGSTVGGYATTTNTASITNQISSVNANITLANTGMQGYVNLANTIQSAQLTSANLGIIGYIDQANTIQSAQVGAANLAITAANLGMKGYVDSVASQSIYGNGNVKSYLTQFDGNIVPSANAVYSLGSVTNQWKSLFVSNNTIFVGGVPLGIDTTGNLTINGTVIPTISYVNTVVANVVVDLSSYALNANVTAANVGIKGYVDLANTIQGAQLTSANLGVIGYIDLANTIQSAQVGAANLAITAANVGMRGYVDNQITTITGGAPAILDTLGELANALGADANLSVTITSQIANVNANITTANLGMRGYVDSQSFYSNVKVATYLPTYSGNISANISKAGYTWTFGTGGTTQFPNSIILAPAGESITMWSDNYSQLMWENANLTVAPNMAINSNFYVAQNNATLDIGYRDGSSTQLIKSWYWNVDGNLKLPSGGYILNSDDSIYGGGSSYSNVEVAAYLPTYSGNVANITLSPSGVLTFADGTTQITAGGGSYSNVQVATYLAGSSSTSFGNTSTHPLSSNVRQIFIGNSTALTSGNGTSPFATSLMYNMYFAANNTPLVRNAQLGAGMISLDLNGFTVSGLATSQTANAAPTLTNLLRITSAGAATFVGTVTAAAGVTSVGAIAVNSALGITSNQATQLIFNQTVTTITMGTGAATTINLGTTAAPTSNVFVGGTLGTNVYGLTLRANGQFNLVTSLNSAGGYATTTYSNIAVTGGSGTGMIISMSGAASGYLASATVTNPGTGYRSGDTITIPAGNPVGSLGGSFVLQNYHANRSNIGTGIWQLGIDGNLTAPGNISISSGSSYFLGNSVGTTAAYTGNVSANYFVGNGALLTGIVAGSSYSNVQVATYLPTYSGVVTASNVAVAGNVTAQYLFGNGSQLTGIASSYSNVEVAAYLNATGYNLYSNVNVANYLTTATITTTGNITAGNLITGGALYVANITTTGSSGNISGANYITANVILTNGGWGNISQVALITANVVTATSYIKVTPTTVANLISASTVGAGARDFVTDANTITFGSVVGGSGANNMPVFSNGTSWLIG